MTEIDRIIAENACKKLAARYFHLINPLQLEALVDLFSESGEIVRGGPHPLHLQGRDEIRAYLDGPHEDLKVYAGVNTVVDVVDDQTAEGRCQALVIEAGKRDQGDVPQGRLLKVLWYCDVYHKTEGGWRIARREVGRLVDNSGVSQI